MKKIIFIVSVVWIALVGTSFLWAYSTAKKDHESIAFQTARSFFDQIILTREWNALHGGVYVPVTKSTQPNPYLDVPLREIKVNQELMLTKVNPAFMTRQIAEIASKYKGTHFHITSLRPIRPENRPTAREKKALQLFEKGKREIGEYIGKGSESSFFYMAPLKVKKVCLQCHAKQGYKEGDIRGGISVTLPFPAEVPLMALIIGHLGIGLAGIFGIIIFGKRLNRAYETIRQQSVTDDLTDIPNRRSFSEIISREFNRCRRDKAPFSVIMCDIDKFKDYNDNYGHAVGDECLKKVAQRIAKTLNRPGDFCARYGGEEFVVILPDTTHKGALHVAEKIRMNVQELRIDHKKSTNLGIVTISLGVAVADENTLISQEELIRRSDTALYTAKAKGRNCVEVFNEICIPTEDRGSADTLNCS